MGKKELQMFGIDLFDASLVPSMIVALLGGLLSFLSPCVLPIVPPYLAYMGGFRIFLYCGAIDRFYPVRRDGLCVRAVLFAKPGMVRHPIWRRCYGFWGAFCGCVPYSHSGP